MKVVPLQKPEPDQAVLDAARDFMAAVESGDVKGIAMVSVHPNGYTTIWRAGEQGAALIGRLEDLKFRIIRDYTDL